LTLSNLQGIYTFIKLCDEWELTELKEKLQLVREDDVGETVPNTISYDNAMKEPIRNMYSVSVMNFPPLVNLLKYSSSPTVISRSEYFGYQFETCADNVAEYISGILFMSGLYHIVVPNKPLIILRMTDIRDESNYQLVSPLSEFPLTSLPVELVSQILSYYPADWYRVCKDFYGLVRQDLISDIRIKYGSRIKGAVAVIKEATLSRGQITSLIDLINDAGISIELRPLLSIIPQGTEIIMRTLAEKIIQIDGLANHVNNDIGAASFPYISWLFENYDEAYYLADRKKVFSSVINYTHEFINSSPSPKLIYLFLNRIAVIDEFFLIFDQKHRIDSEDIYKLTVDIISNKGVITKTGTNPFTGKTREGYVGDIIDINVGRYVKKLIDYIVSVGENRSDSYKAYINIILYLVKNYSVLESTVMPLVLDLFAQVSTVITDPVEAVKYLNFILPLAVPRDFASVLKILLNRLIPSSNQSLAPRVATLNEEAKAAIETLEDLLFRRNLYQHGISSQDISIQIVLEVLSKTTQSLEEGELKDRYQRLCDYVGEWLALLNN
jgi:hypothetical protein